MRDSSVAAGTILSDASRFGLAALVVLLVGVGTRGVTALDRALVDFGPGFDPAKISATDAKVEQLPGGKGLRVATGHHQEWPGITLPASAGKWDLSAYAQVEVQLRNTGANEVTVFCRIDNPGADGTKNCLTRSLSLNPGGSGVLQIPLKRALDDNLDGKLFGMKGYPVAPGGPGTIDAGNVVRMIVFVTKPGEDHLFEIAGVRAAGTYTPPTAWATDAAPFFPCIDSFGQYRHKDWPGKVHSLADLKSRGQIETRELAANPGPANWDKFGGSASGPQLKATGFFRTEKVRGKWWLIDPQGRLFFSHGIDCVGAVDSTPVDDRENWFADSPGNQPEFAAFRSHAFVLKGYYAGRSPACFSFVEANLLRKYGTDWQQQYRRLVHRRLRSWGINTIANWSDDATRRLRQTPYTDSLGSGRTKPISGSDGYWGKFPDVFDPGFAGNLRQAMESKQGDSVSDPWCIGFFSDNEMSWGDEISLALGTLQSPPEQAAKVVFLQDLKNRYDQIEALNTSWGAHYESWDALLQSREAPDRVKAANDLKAFYTRIAEQYFRTVRDTIKASAPNQLYLGCRFAWVNARAAAAAAKYCDVVSYNLYRRSVADFQFNGGADVPLLIGEFHFGALDRGVFHTGLVAMPDQKARADTYKSYVQGALHHPQFVGCHWFQYFDEPTTGRAYDEENYQIGFVDIADTPYAETIAACRQVGYSLYPNTE
jgi:hypothetical protein